MSDEDISSVNADCCTKSVTSWLIFCAGVLETFWIVLAFHFQQRRSLFTREDWNQFCCAFYLLTKLGWRGSCRFCEAVFPCCCGWRPPGYDTSIRICCTFLSWLSENTSDPSGTKTGLFLSHKSAFKSFVWARIFRVVSIWACAHLPMPSQVLRWCSVPPSCLLPLRNLIVRAAEEEEEQQQEVEVWAQGAACRLYTAWFSHRTNCTRLSPTRPLGSPFAPKSELTSWSAKCFLMSAWPPAEQEMVGAFGTGWEGGAVGRPRLRPAKLPKVPVVRVLKVCATAEALGGSDRGNKSRLNMFSVDLKSMLFGCMCMVEYGVAVGVCPKWWLVCGSHYHM